MNQRRISISLFLALLCACATSSDDREPEPFDDLGRHHRPITTSSTLAQRWFDQGLTLYYAFNHDEAIYCFEQVTRLDPSCAMGWWGIALANGPHINNPAMAPER